MADAIIIDKLAKRYGAVQALHDISVHIPAGRITGLLGPNGAGKSTTIKAIVGALNPTAGTIHVLGLDPIRDSAKLRKRLGYMPQEPALYGDLSARENVTLYARVHQVHNARVHAERLLTELELGERLGSAAYTLSGGMQKRVSLASTLVHNPELLILDEPTAALDPFLKRKLWERFRSLADQGKTLLISTHLMDEAMLCDSVVLIQHGRVVAHDTPRNLIAGGRATIVYRQGTDEKYEQVAADRQSIARALQAHGLSKNIHELEVHRENLEEVMMHILEKGERP